MLRYTIWRILNECGEQTSEELGLLLEMDPANLSKRHLSPLVEQGVVERAIPDRINHPEQAYRSTRFPPGAHRPAVAQGRRRAGRRTTSPARSRKRQLTADLR